VLMDAYSTDVRLVPRQVRAEMGLDPVPLLAYARSGYADQVRADRVGGPQAGWGA
jgi:L-rhamnose isomerase/sugar isomerase